MKSDIKDKVIIFFSIYIAVSLFWSSLGIILSLALYFATANNIPLIIKFLTNLGCISIPSFITIILGILIFKKEYKIKYILTILAIPLVIAICEHIVFIRLY